jgi:AraC-like DNA-binding protein
MQMIAEQLGYATSGNFSRFFQRRFDCTPRDWMRALGEGDDAQGARGRSNLMTADTFSGL